MGRRKNPLPSFHAQDQEPLVSLVKRACGCSKKTAKAIADAFPDGVGLPTATTATFRQLGATKRQADQLHAALELYRYAIAGAYKRHATLRQPSDVAYYLRSVIGHGEEENFVVIYVDSRQRVLDTRLVSRGSLSQVDVHPRELFRDAVRLRAHAIILAHNHPSGDAEPSEADVSLTHRMAEVGRLMGIPVLDHVVVTAQDHASLAQIGLVPKH